MNNYQIIDINTWERADHFNLFKNFALPQIGITTELDITNFRRKTKENAWSFSFAFIHLVAKCANEIKNFRYRFYHGDAVHYNKINTTFTYMNHDTNLFKIVSVETTDNINNYINKAIETAKNQDEYLTTLPNNTYLFSALPWLTYTHLSSTCSGNKEDATPKFHWGKYFERDGKLFMPFSIHAHHAFVDGLHIGKLVQRIQEDINILQ